MKSLARNTLIGVSVSLVSLGGLAGTASAGPGAGTPADPILCTITSPDPSACAGAPDDGSGDPGEAPASQPAAPAAEDPLCGLTAGLVCAPTAPGGGEEAPEEGGETGEEPSAGEQPSPYSAPVVPAAEDPLCGLTAGLVCAPTAPGGGAEAPEEGGETGEEGSADEAPDTTGDEEFEDGEGSSGDDVEESEPPEYGPGSDPGAS